MNRKLPEFLIIIIVIWCLSWLWESNCLCFSVKLIRVCGWWNFYYFHLILLCLVFIHLNSSKIRAKIIFSFPSFFPYIFAADWRRFVYMMKFADRITCWYNNFLFSSACSSKILMILFSFIYRSRVRIDHCTFKPQIVLRRKSGWTY